MRSGRVAVLGLATLVLLGGTAGCGGEQSVGQPGAGGTHEQAPADKTTVVVIRSGGFAGFRDTVRIPSEGQASIVRRTGPARSCQPDPAAVERLRRLDLAAVGPAPRPSTPVADAFSYTVIVHHRSATAAEGEHGRRAELVDAAAAVVASCLTTQSGQPPTGSPR